MTDYIVTGSNPDTPHGATIPVTAETPEDAQAAFVAQFPTLPAVQVETAQAYYERLAVAEA